MASGDSLLQWSMLSNEPPTTAFATPDLRNLHPVLDFAPTPDEEAVFSGVMPQHYTAAASVVVFIHYAMSTATTGDIVLDAQFERVGDGSQDIDADGFAAVQSLTVVGVPATSGNVDIVSITFTSAQADAIAKGEGFRLKIRRDGDNVADTAAGDLELRWVELREA
mgnify:CR=1 FL=1